MDAILKKQRRQAVREQKLTDHTWALSFIAFRLPKVSAKERKKVYREIEKLWDMVQPKASDNQKGIEK